MCQLAYIKKIQIIIIIIKAIFIIERNLFWSLPENIQCAQLRETGISFYDKKEFSKDLGLLFFFQCLFTVSVSQDLKEVPGYRTLETSHMQKEGALKLMQRRFREMVVFLLYIIMITCGLLKIVQNVLSIYREYLFFIFVI